MKKKALRHLELQEKIFNDKQRDQHLEIKALGERVEELLDLTAKNRLESQEQTKSMEARYQDKLKRTDRDNVELIEIRTACDRVLKDLLG